MFYNKFDSFNNVSIRITISANFYYFILNAIYAFKYCGCKIEIVGKGPSTF